MTNLHAFTKTVEGYQVNAVVTLHISVVILRVLGIAP